MKKAVLIVMLVFMFALGGCSSSENKTDGEFMPEVKNSSDVFEIYDYSEQKLVKSVDMTSDENALLVCDSIINNVDNSVNYLNTMDEVTPDYVLLYCGESQDEYIYVKIRLSEGKLYRQIYGTNEKAMTLDQGILECITVTEDEFKNILE